MNSRQKILKACKELSIPISNLYYDREGRFWEGILDFSGYNDPSLHNEYLGTECITEFSAEEFIQEIRDYIETLV